MATVRLLLVLLLPVLAITAPATSWGQDWPSRPVRFIVPYPARRLDRYRGTRAVANTCRARSASRSSWRTSRARAA